MNLFTRDTPKIGGDQGYVGLFRQEETGFSQWLDSPAAWSGRDLCLAKFYLKSDNFKSGRDKG